MTASVAPQTALAVEPPADIPRDIFDAAVATFLDCRRLDMRALSGELGISRATLYRHAGGRDRLLGEVLCYRTRLALAAAAVNTDRLKGEKRVVTIVERFMRRVHSSAPLHRLLESEPETALRLLTSKHGPVQRRVIDGLERLLAHEESNGDLRLGVDPAALAYAIVRIGESFLYADVIADNDPDVDQAVTLVARLLRSE